MNETNKIYLINSAGPVDWLSRYKQNLEHLTLDDLRIRDEKYHDAVVLIDNNQDHCKTIKEILPINPGINFILYYHETIKPSQLVEFVKSGILESVSTTDTKRLKMLLEQYGGDNDDARINYKNNLINKFRDIGIITNSMKMADIFALIEKVAHSNSTVLINGENGTGKELIARSIHYFSNRKDYKFVGVNTGAIPENLLEDELFGHIKGSFTNALKDRKGKFEYAHRGTIFLDEISNMPSTLQVKLLRVLQEREFERIGDNQTVQVDVRVIAATNRDIKEMVDQEQFREDLYYRLNVIPLTLPPLRDRRTDIPVLANYFVSKYANLNNHPPKNFTLPAIRILQAYSWPGNIRQLENIIERMVVLNPDASVFMPKDIPAEVKPDLPANDASHFVPDEIPDEGVSLSDVVRNVERSIILKSLEKTSWNKQKAAKLLNVKRTTLIEKIKKMQDQPD